MAPISFRLAQGASRWCVSFFLSCTLGLNGGEGELKTLDLTRKGGLADNSYEGPQARRRSSAAPASDPRVSVTYQPPLNRFLAAASSSSATSSRRRQDRHSSLGGGTSPSRQRALPPTPPAPAQLAEEDECPICHGELPPRALANWEVLRESHVAQCIQAHSTYGSPSAGGQGATASLAAARRTGMYTYSATEKDCVDDAECTICLEEYTVGVAMARLECLCRFHRACITAWFVNHPGQCPVHQHDGIGF